MDYVWINKKFIEWDAVSDGASIRPPNSLHRTYELWNHANDILAKHTTKDYLSDAISNLNKAIGTRIKMLNENYHFNKSPFKAKDKKIYKQLEEFGIVRPKLINEITEFRNNIEHNDKTPPPHKKCQDFLEICWYFLKATDLYVLYIKDSILFENPKNNKYWVSVNFNFEKGWSASIRGWLTPTDISISDTSDFIKIRVERSETRQQFIDRSSRKDKKGFFTDEDQRGQNPEDVYFSGQLLSNQGEFAAITKQYFKTII